MDDAYAEYMKNNDYKSGLKLFKNKQNVFILRTFSKIYGLSSLRVGWGYGSKKIIKALNVIKPPFNVNEVAQKAAIESLKDTKFITRSVKHNIIYAKKLKNFLNQYGINSNNISANFLLKLFSLPRSFITATRLPEKVNIPITIEKIATKTSEIGKEVLDNST